MSGELSGLTDKEIGRAMKAGRLIKNGDPGQLAGACYELRLGDVYYDLTESDQPIPVTKHGNALLKPGHRIVLITHEELEVPPDVLARVFSKGSLFSVGLSPTATYADPGFAGHIGIVTQNISNKYIVLPTRETIAKVEFTRLSSNVAKPYTGQHGFRTQIWPIKHHLQKTYAELAGDPRLKPEADEQQLLLPTTVSRMLKQVHERQRWFGASIFAALLINAGALFLVGNKMIDNLQSLAVNLVSTALIAIAAWWVRRSS